MSHSANGDVITDDKAFANKSDPKSRRTGCRAALKRAFKNLTLIVLVIAAISFVKTGMDNRRIYAVTPFGAFNSLAKLQYDKSVIAYPAFAQPLMDSFSFVMPSVPHSSFMDRDFIKLDKKYSAVAAYWELRPGTDNVSRAEALEKAIQLSPGVPDLIYMHAIESRPEGAGNPEDDFYVINAIEKARELEPDNGCWNFLAAIELNHLGEWDRSLREMESALKAREFRVPEDFARRNYDQILFSLYNEPAAIAKGLAYLDAMSINMTGSKPHSQVADAYKNLQVAVAMGAEAEALETYYGCALRYAKAGFKQPDVIDFGRYIRPLLIAVDTVVLFNQDGTSNDFELAAQIVNIKVDAIRDVMTALNDASSWTSLYSMLMDIYPLTAEDINGNGDIDIFSHAMNIEDTDGGMSIQSNIGLFRAAGSNYMHRSRRLQDTVAAQAQSNIVFQTFVQKRLEELEKFNFNDPGGLLTFVPVYSYSPQPSISGSKSNSHIMEDE